MCANCHCGVALPRPTRYGFTEYCRQPGITASDYLGALYTSTP